MVRLQNDVTGVIIAGGKSERFGSNKALAAINGVPIVQSICSQVQLLLSNVLIISNTPEDYRFLNIPVYKDIVPNKGPIGGLHTALELSFSPWIFVTPCDLPLFSFNGILALARETESTEVVCFSRENKLEPFPAIFNKKLVPKLLKFLKAENYAMQRFLHSCEVTLVPIESNRDCVAPNILTNCNTVQDYEKIPHLTLPGIQYGKNQ